MAEESEKIRADSSERQSSKAGNEVLDWSNKRTVLSRGATFPSSPRNGEVFLWENGNDDNFFVYSGIIDNWMPLDAFQGVKTSTSTVANTVTETTVFTETLPANTLNVGEVIKVKLLGRYGTANATDTFTLRLKVGGTTVLTITSTASNETNAPVSVEFFITVRSIGASGTIFGFAEGEFANEDKSVAGTSTETLDTTIAENVVITIEWSSANASNTVSIDQGWLELHN